MKKHLHRLALVAGLVFLAIALAVMMSQTIGRKKASFNLPFPEHSVIRIPSN